MYCTRCGKELHEGAAFCHSCGKSVGTKQNAAVPEWTAAATLLASGSMGFAKCLLWVLGGGMSLACGAAGLGSFVISCYMLYHFAIGVAIKVPLFLASIIPVATLHGFWLVFAGLTGILIALLLLAAALTLGKCIFTVKWRATA